MFDRCLFCHGSFEPNDELPHLPRGRRVAFDPAEGRLWLICRRCHRWNLVPVEARHRALHELERLARDTATPLARTANVELLAAARLTLIRVGRADLAERAWWRYGRELRRREAAFHGTAARVTAYTFGAVRWVGELLGVADPDVDITWDDTPVADILRWRRFGWAAWHGRTTCPYCGSTLRALRYDMSWWVYPLQADDGRLTVGVPCQRCDPWTPDNLYTISGPESENVLRRCLAYQNITGAGERAVRDAARAIEEAGSAGDFTAGSATRRESLWKMGSTGTIALEIALSESVESRLLEMEARALEFMWRREAELARIIDEELTPRSVLARHLARLPATVGRRGEERPPRILRRVASPRGR